jgi:hypothetical protein
METIVGESWRCTMPRAWRRGAFRLHRGSGDRTRDQLYEEAKHKGVKGRSRMNKAQLERAVDR